MIRYILTTIDTPTSGEATIMAEAPDGAWVRYEDVPQWRDIASAPRDGTAVLVTAGGLQRVAWTKHSAEAGNDGVWCYHIARGGPFTVMFGVTHWMPLPALPASPGVGAQAEEPR